MHGKDRATRGVELQTGKRRLERPVKLTYLMDRSVIKKHQQPGSCTSSPHAEAFRSTRKAAEDTQARIKAIADKEHCCEQ